MQKFVDVVAKHLLESEIPLKNWVLILPSERAKQYIQKALFEQIQKPFFAPKMFTINNWVGQFSDKTIIDKTHLLLELYDIHHKYPSTEIDTSFDEFLSWGRILMSDFDEMERYLVDSDALFKNLKDIKDIENWSFNSTEELSENQQKYLEFWNRLGAYFKELQKRLYEKNCCLMGTVYRNLAEKTQNFIDFGDETHFLFAGFNALSLAEMQIMRNLVEAQKATILLDSDSFYLNDKNHEAGYFLRKFRDFLGVKELPLLRNELKSASKSIEIISCSQTTGQVKVASTILSEIPESELSETLVLLADESLIIPLLQNLPKTLKKVNITLGLPLKSTALFTWLELIFSVQEGILRNKRTSIYFKDLFNFWNHPFVQEILSDKEKSIIYNLEKNMRKRNVVYQSLKNIQISSNFDSILAVLYTPWENSFTKAIELIRSMNRMVFDNFDADKETNKLEKAIIQRFDEVIIDFQNCVNEVTFPEMSLRSFKILFQQEWSSETIAYYGNPIDGLQVMGLLETRLLDFKNVLILGLNEGKMPPTNPINSLIPMDLRKVFSLPLPRDKQGLFAHHFYRLLHGAEKMYITYQNGAEGISFAEQSRYISQLELELSKFNKNIRIVRKDYTLMQDLSATERKVIEKTPEILAQLDFLFSQGVSPTMLKKYFTCPLDFYYQYVLKFGEEKNVEEELESYAFGVIIHAVLQELYEKFSNEKMQVTVLDLDKMLLDYKTLLFDGFKNHFNGDEDAFLKGNNFLSYSIAQDMLEKFLKSEKKFLQENPNSPLFISALEYKIEHEMEVEVFGQKKKIMLRGDIDRVDKIGNKIRILDYKTGSVKKEDVDKEFSKNELDDYHYLLKACRDVKHFFQLYTYLYLYKQKSGKTAQLCGIISFVNVKDNPYLLRAKELDVETLIAYYPKVLKGILEEIYDEKSAFSHDSKAYYCAYCQ